MPMSIHTANRLASLVASYFDAWQRHDSALLRHIFAPQAPYRIAVPGKRSYQGIEEICAYWERNAARQRDLRLEWQILEPGERLMRVAFTARFFDREEHQYQSVAGSITFETDETSAQITALSEVYHKVTMPE